MTGACPNCGETQGTLEFRGPAFDADSSASEFDVVRCPACNLVGTRGVTDAILDEAYQAEYYGAGQRKFAHHLERILEVLARRRATALIRTWRQFGGHGEPSVVDIGCGRGILLKAFKAKGADVLGIERSPEPIDADIASDVHLGKLSDDVLDGRQFDIIVVWHVLEHVPNPDQLLDEIAAHAAEGSLLALAVPNYASLQRRLFAHAWFHLDLPRHLTHFEAAQLEQRFTDRRFEIVHAGHFDVVQNPYGFLQSALNRIMPTHSNELYEQLKGGKTGKREGRWPTPIWLCLAAALSPLAIIESVIAGLSRRGATISIIARKGTRP